MPTNSNIKAEQYLLFCPHCGYRFKPGDNFHCPQCGFTFYQNSRPTVSAFITDEENRIVLAERAIEPKKGWWDAPGGFLEDGEKPEVGLEREIREELGVGLKDVMFFNIYMDTYTHDYTFYTLNIIYTAQLAAQNMKPADDVASIKWFERQEIPWRRLAFNWLKKALKDWQ